MPKTDRVDWFGADTTTKDGGKTTTAILESVTKANGRPLRVRTSGKDDRIAELTARYKLARSAAEIAPLDDRPAWERRREIAYCEMQLERFAQQLEKYRARSDARPEQIEHYEQRLDMMRGRWLRLTGQEN